MTVKEARKFLGESQSSSLTDQEIEGLLGNLYTLADIISEQVKANVSNCQLGVIDSIKREDQNGGS